MKRILLVLVCACSLLTVSAQTKVGWSMKLGLGMSTWMGKDAGNSSALFNPKVGVGIDIPLTGLVSFQTGLMWESKGASYNIRESNSEYDVTCNQNYFQMPLLAAFHVGTPANFDMVFTVGPYLAYGVNGKTEYEVDDVTTSWSTFGNSKLNGVENDGLDRLDAGIQAGVAMDFSRWTVGLDGDFSFVKIAQGRNPYNLAFYLTCAYKF